MRSTSKAKYQAVYFTVKGTGIFPIDMLRYDSCMPRSQEDVSRIEQREFNIDSKQDPTKPDEVSLRGYYRVESFRYHAGEFPTRLRWRSQGWPVVLGSVHDIPA